MDSLGKRQKMTMKYRSDIFAAAYKTMGALHEVGAIDKQTMREFDDACLKPVQVLSLEEVKSLRIREHSPSRFLPATCDAQFEARIGKTPRKTIGGSLTKAVFTVPCGASLRLHEIRGFLGAPM